MESCQIAGPPALLRKAEAVSLSVPLARGRNSIESVVGLNLNRSLEQRVGILEQPVGIQVTAAGSGV
jgi:hypothetical protein